MSYVTRILQCFISYSNINKCNLFMVGCIYNGYDSLYQQPLFFKGPIPSVLVFIFTLQIKCLCLVELIFIMKPQGLHVLLGEIRKCTYALCNFFSNNQMALSFNINIITGYIFYCKTILRF